MTATPRRCLKCQRFGHYASECKAMADMCALCTLNHRTNLCPTPDNPPKCANCTGDLATRHGTADKECPSLLSETHKLHHCHPKSKYKYFPTDNPNMWRLLSEPESAMSHTPNPTTPQHPPAQHCPNGNFYRPDFTNCNNQYYPDPRHQGPPPDKGWWEIRRQHTNGHLPPRGSSYVPLSLFNSSNPRHRDMGWPTRPLQSTLDAHFIAPQTHDSSRSQPAPARATHVDSDTTNTATNHTATATTSTSATCTLRWSDKNFEDLVNSLPPLDFPNSNSPPALEYA